MEAKRIADQLHRSFHGTAWHGPAVLELFADVSAARAAARPLPNAHTIWEIALHIGAWVDAARRGLEGETVDLSPEQDWPAVSDTGAQAWRETLGALEHSQRELERRIEQLSDAQLADQVPGGSGKRYSAYFLLHGVIQHNLYHAGQIALLKKAT